MNERIMKNTKYLLSFCLLTVVIVVGCYCYFDARGRRVRFQNLVAYHNSRIGVGGARGGGTSTIFNDSGVFLGFVSAYEPWHSKQQWHKAMKKKYAYAASHAWLPVLHDPPEPQIRWLHDLADPHLLLPKSAYHHQELAKLPIVWSSFFLFLLLFLVSANNTSCRGSELEDRPDGRTATHRNARIPLLVIGHVIAGIVCFYIAMLQIGTPLASYELALVPFYATLFCQVILLGFWVTFADTAWWKRLAGFTLGGACLECLFNGTVEDNIPLAFVTLFAVGIVLLIMRLSRLRLRHFPCLPQCQDQHLRFSIRGLMLLTLIVALLIAGTTGLSSSVFGFIFLYIACHIIVGLASIWAALRIRRPVERIAVVIAFAGALASLFAYGYDDMSVRSRFQSTWEYYFCLISTLVLEAVFLIGSFLVVRSCGYRLVRLAVRRQARTIRGRDWPPNSALLRWVNAHI
jgi:drug/metabolite transporter (DMT)-like permease